MAGAFIEDVVGMVKNGFKSVKSNAAVNGITNGITDVLSPQKIVQKRYSDISKAGSEVVENSRGYADAGMDIAKRKIAKAQADMLNTHEAATGSGLKNHIKGFGAGTRDINGKMVGGFKNNGMDWILAKDFEDEGMKRIGVGAARAGVASFAVGTTGRMVTGNGGAFTDKYGERDIAGIPFI